MKLVAVAVVVEVPEEAPWSLFWSSLRREEVLWVVVPQVMVEGLVWQHLRLLLIGDSALVPRAVRVAATAAAQVQLQVL